VKRPETLEETAARLGCSLDTAAMFQRKPRARRAAMLDQPRGASARVAAMAGPAPEPAPAPALDQSAELLALMVRVGELERTNAVLLEEARRTFRGSSAAWLRNKREARRVRWARGGGAPRA
jgi:hypothetical protein